MRIVLMILCLCLTATPALAASGMLTVQSAFDVPTTADRLEAVLKAKGMTIFNRIDHAAAATGVGVDLRPTVLVIFGNPQAGSQLMRCAPTVAIDLPQKALIWQDAYGAVWIGYNDPRYLADRHGLTGCEAPLEKLGKALLTFATAAATP